MTMSVNLAPGSQGKLQRWSVLEDVRHQRQ